jgi:hypothetical protein
MVLPNVQPGYGLTLTQTENLLNASLKPEEIAGSPETQHNRVNELIRWFARYTQGNANPKWLAAHACELAYYIATTDAARHLDLRQISANAFDKGVHVTDEQRALLLRLSPTPEEPSA